MTAGTALQTPASASDDEVVADGVLRRIARQLAPYKKQMILVGLVVLLAAALTSIAPFLTRASSTTPCSRSTAGRWTSRCCGGWSPG